jgi:MoaE-MoaD fusion protein
MELRVLYFAHVRECVGLSSECLTLSEGMTVKDAVNILEERYPTLRELLPVVRIALNGEFIADDTPLRNEDELVLIPPVAGGSGMEKVALTDSPLNDAYVQRMRASVAGPDHGALVTFLGVVRDYARGRTVSSIDYEAYESMARREMVRIAAEVEAEYDGVRVALHHRVGHLRVGDAAVAVVTSSAHRKEAFGACQEVLERLKADVPIWKNEKGPDGSDWVSDRP